LTGNCLGLPYIAALDRFMNLQLDWKFLIALRILKTFTVFR